MKNEDRKAIAEKVRALRAKAADVASTEAEAMQAAAMVAKLLARYDLSEQDVADYDPGKAAAVQGELADAMSVVLSCSWSGITALTETSAYLGANRRLCFIGMEPDVEMALYLSEVIEGACARAIKAGFKGANAKQRKSFQMGFGSSVKAKLMQLAEERKAAKTATGTAIVIRKGDLVKAFEAEAGLNLGRGRRSRASWVDARYYEAGRTVGKSLNVGRPLSGGNKSERLA